MCNQIKGERGAVSVPWELEMAKPDGIYGPLFDYAQNNVEKLGDRPASGLIRNIIHFGLI